MQKTLIEWTRGDDGSPGYTSNPFRARNIATGKMGHQCEIVSPGCERCYSGAWNGWRGAGTPFTHSGAELTEPVLDEAELLRLLRTRKAGRVFCFDMTDAFWSRYPDEWLDKFFAVVACQQNLTFQVLTKRAKRLPEYFRPEATERWAIELERIGGDDGCCCTVEKLRTGELWPLPNLWLGVSCEDQRRADERIPYLLKTPAAVRFVSAEPLLGPIDLAPYLGGAAYSCTCGFHRTENELVFCGGDHWECPMCQHWCEVLSTLDWVIVGGESGRGARPMHPEWARDIRDQCQAASVPYFFKQWGRFAGSSPLEGRVREHEFADGIRVFDVGKKAAGRLLDRREWNEFPHVGSAETARATDG